MATIQLPDKRSDIIGLTMGESVTLSFTITDENGNSVTDMTGWQAAFYLLPSLATPRTSALVTKQSPSGVSFSPPQINVSLQAADTSSLKSGIYAYELWRTDTGNERRLAYGLMLLGD